jgi:hypothetical protein
MWLAQGGGHVPTACECRNRGLRAKESKIRARLSEAVGF